MVGAKVAAVETVVGTCSNCHQPTADLRPTVMLFPKREVQLCDDCYQNSVMVQTADGARASWYTPQPHQRPYHESDVPNLLALGTRGTGKSKMMRADAIIRCMKFPGFKALILRRKIPDLKKSHLRFIRAEMAALDGGVDGPANRVGYYRETTTDVTFKNGSFIQFSHCETMKDVENYLSSEWDLIVFDEVVTFLLDMFLRICSAARSSEYADYISLVRAGSNTLGIGAVWMKQWFIDKSVDLTEYPDYNPDDYDMHFSTLNENAYVNRREYEKRLRNLPDHVRRSWLLGEFVIEGAYFTEFRRMKRLDSGEDVPWHCIPSAPRWRASDGQMKAFGHPDLSWISVYRAVDWGYSPDPAVCLWFAVLPNHHTIVLKEQTWKRTLAKDVAADIKRESAGMHVIETFADPTMMVMSGNSPYTIGEIFEQNGVPLTPSQNDRELYGYAIHEHLNTLIDGHPKLQMVEHACAELVRTLPILEMDANDPRKIANGPDHWACALAYFCMGLAMPTRDPVANVEHRWMKPKHKPRNIAIG